MYQELKKWTNWNQPRLTTSFVFLPGPASQV